VSAALIGVNWYTYIWAVQNGHVLDSSLGYFITPLFSVLLGRLVLGERPRAIQWVAVGVAALGVLWLGLRAGHVPWVGLVLASTFSAYGLAKKLTPLGALEGLAVETAMLFPLAIAALPLLAAQEVVVANEPSLRWLLIAAGPLTALPMLLFGAGARLIPLMTLGLLQYISPTLQLLVGVVILGEAFSVASLLGYLLIWSALAIYAVDGIARARTAPAAR
jgi:chloramphenicol-sensitive protein RarD